MIGASEPSEATRQAIDERCALISLTCAAAAVTMSRRGVLAQQLNAIESLASVDTICVDKTGTLTEASLRVVELQSAPGSGLYLVLTPEAGSSRKRSALVGAMCAVMRGALCRRAAAPGQSELLSVDHAIRGIGDRVTR
jgi:magnesium-transporting ATPase (P-type)